ncbi:MAG: NAD(P)-binding protein [Syntrophales bacterium]|nr:NAD(P)-binding protein [Syntrophales bacterium]
MKKEDPSGRILIIGSGIGGLSAGIILSMLGFPVTVVEKNRLPGGMMRGYRRFGMDCPVGVHYMGALDLGQPFRRLWDYLGVTPAIPLERMGTNGVIDRYIFDDFEFDLPVGIDAFEENLLRAFPDEHCRIEEIMTDLRRVSQSLSKLEVITSPALTILSPESFEPMGERLARMGCSRRLMNVLSVPSTLIGVPLTECPVFYYYMTLASYLMSSWRLACGSADMADAFINRLKALGGEMVTGDEVKTICIESGRVRGITLSSGRTMEGTTVVAAIHPTTLLSLLPPAAVRPAYAERVSQLIDTKGLISINAAVDDASPKSLPYNLYRLHPEADGYVSRGVFCQLRPSGKAGTNLLSVITTSEIEDWLPWERTRSGKRGDNYEAVKKEKAAGLIGEAEALLGRFAEIKMVDVYTPLTLRDWVNSPGGSPYGILRTTGQLMKAASLNRTIIKGIYLAGQNRLCPGIMGTTLGSFQMVKQMLGQERFTRDVAGGFL